MNINYIKQHCTDLSHDDTIRKKYYRKRFNSLFYIMLGVLFIGVVGMGVMAILSISHNKDYNLIGISCLLPAAFWGVICLHQYAKYDLIIIKQYYREHITQRLINGNWFQRQKEIDRIFFEIRRKSWRDFCTKYSIPHSCTAQYNIKTWLYSSIKPSRIKYLFIKDCTAPQKLDTFGVFFMKYNYEIRLKAVKLVLEGGLSVREAGCHLGCGRSQVHLWVTLFERHGLTGLKLRHGSYSAEFKLSVLKHMHQNHLSLLETAVHFGIPGPFVIRQWERLYQNQGAEGLRRKPQRRRPAMSKSKTKKVKLKTTPHEELLKELEYLRAENAYLKKLQALVEERIVRESGKEPKPSKD